MENYILKECVVVGAGISGLAMGRWLRNSNIDFVIIERSDDIGGLWRYTENEYGVMEFTHINVSKYNYCFSDHQFPVNSTDYPHHSEMFNYIKSYANKHEMYKNILFKNQVELIEELDNEHQLNTNKPKFETIKFYDKLWKVTVNDLKTSGKTVYITPYISIASGHHGTPIYADFPGLNTFKGQVIHSVKFKSARVNNMVDKRVLIVGIGNSAVDAAVNLVNEGRCSKVVISTRSGAWIVPNYIAGYATDLYASRAILYLPWKVVSTIFETTIKFIYGNPKNYNLNPKMRVSQTQPTVSPTLIHHIQRKHITIMPNIKRISENEVTFDDDRKEEFDCIILCTGYKIDLGFLHENIRNKIFSNREQTVLNLFKQAFHPKIGRSLGFIGYAQPTSGGLLTISEMQARWQVRLMLNHVKLPSESEMYEKIKHDHDKNAKRFHNSQRHTIQEDPIKYNDEVGNFIGVAPNFFQNLTLLWRLLFSSSGPAQWRLNGPDSFSNAADIVKQVPVTDMMKFFSFLVFLLLLFVVYQVYKYPIFFTLVGVSYVFYQSFVKHRD